MDTTTHQTQTISAYNGAVQLYIDRSPATVDGTLKIFMDTFLNEITAGSTIFEIGSGSGRDGLYIEQQGFQVDRSDATPGFVSYLREQGYEVLELNILEQAPPQQYPAILADAVLLHFNPNELSVALHNIAKGLVDDGVFALTVKRQVSDIKEEIENQKLGADRYFYYWKDEELIQTLQQHGFELLHHLPDETFIQLITRLNRK